MSLGKQMRWVRGAEGKRVRRMVAAFVVAAGCVWMAAWGGVSTPVAAAARDTATPARAGARKDRRSKRSVALSPWEQAEQGRDALETAPEATRTRADYTHAMDAYRAIYHADPADVHAPAAVNAVAELLAEQGRGLHDEKSLRAAVGQYEFLRTQYPASSLGVQALLAEGQIEQNDLNDAAAARERYKLLLKDHAKSEQAEEARAGLASLDEGRGPRGEARVTMARRDATPGETGPQRPKPGPGVSGDGVLSTLPGTGSNALPSVKHRGQAGQGSGSSLPAMSQTRGEGTGTLISEARPIDQLRAGSSAPDPSVAGDHAHSGKPALVTGIRHWSTATYTRVAIDLGDNVTYEAARVPNPDRIYFDLHGTRLAPELVGKSFAVTDDGFLKRVRAAQYSDDVTRVVLDVDDVTEYSAFLLPNPYRLIIDIHGAAARETSNSRQGTGEGKAESATVPVAALAVPAPRAAVTVRATATRPVPNSVATASASAASEVADLSQLPGRVEATTRPTSKPISAVVAGGYEAQPARSDVATASDAETGARAGTLADAGPATARSVRKTRGSRAKAADAPTAAASADAEDAMPAREAAPTADGETSLVRALGLKIGRIVIDPGHGGHDSGTLGVGGIEEKDVVLDVALRLGKLLHDRLGSEIIYTRSDDTFVPLETRTAIANKAQADLFISIHANSSPDASARGVETYYLNFTTDPTALDVAARENAVSDQSIHQLSDLVKKIALKDKIEESREFAADVESSLYDGLRAGNPGLKDRGVKKAPFVVLIGANMPSILAEISFVTNPRDAALLSEPQYRERVAESLYQGVARYEGGLSGTRIPTEQAAVGQ